MGKICKFSNYLDGEWVLKVSSIVRICVGLQFVFVDRSIIIHGTISIEFYESDEIILLIYSFDCKYSTFPSKPRKNKIRTKSSNREIGNACCKSSLVCFFFFCTDRPMELVDYPKFYSFHLHIRNELSLVFKTYKVIIPWPLQKDHNEQRTKNDNAAYLLIVIADNGST